jgi:hypothetical protein
MILMLDRIKKRQFDGFKEFVQSMEITASASRQQIIMTGILEDPIFMTFVIKNLKTFNDFLKLSSDDITAVLRTKDQMLGLFAKSVHGKTPEEMAEIESLIPTLRSKFKDELSYLAEVSTAEKESAKFFMVKTARLMQMEERIMGFPWVLPPQDLFYPKALKDGKFETHFESGVLAVQGEIFKNKRTNYWKHYYDNGKLLAEGEYSEGMKRGEWKFYFSSGNPKSQGKYMADLKQGQWKEWDRDGKENQCEYFEGVKKT